MLHARPDAPIITPPPTSDDRAGAQDGLSASGIDMDEPEAAAGLKVEDLGVGVRHERHAT